MASIKSKFKDYLNNLVRSRKIKKAKKEATKWLRKQINKFKLGFNNLAATNNDKKQLDELLELSVVKSAHDLKLGDLVMFYYMPKHKDTLPYYDVFPCSQIISVNNNSILGINYHYLHPTQRAGLLDIVSSYGDKVNWRAVAKAPNIEPTVHKYLYSHIKSKMLKIDEESYEYAVMMPMEQFRKKNKKQVWKR